MCFVVDHGGFALEECWLEMFIQSPNIKTREGNYIVKWSIVECRPMFKSQVALSETTKVTSSLVQTCQTPHLTSPNTRHDTSNTRFGQTGAGAGAGLWSFVSAPGGVLFGFPTQLVGFRFHDRPRYFAGPFVSLGEASQSWKAKLPNAAERAGTRPPKTSKSPVDATVVV